MMAVFNNLVLFDQHVPQNTLRSIVPDLAQSWSWSDDGTELTFRLRQGVKWHDGNRSRPRMCSAPGTGCSGAAPPGSGSTHANPGTGTSIGSRPMAITTRHSI